MKEEHWLHGLRHNLFLS